MRAAPAIQVTLKRFGVWHGALLVLSLGAAVVLAAWIVNRPTPLPALWQAATAAAIVASLGFAWAAARVAPVRLTWDGQAWQFAPIDQPDEKVGAGSLTVCIDLGAWMLLRFAEAPSGGWSKATWLPVQRHGLEAQWHALRCAAYSPRPAPAAAPRADR